MVIFFKLRDILKVTNCLLIPSQVHYSKKLVLYIFSCQYIENTTIITQTILFWKVQTIYVLLRLLQLKVQVLGFQNFQYGRTNLERKKWEGIELNIKLFAPLWKTLKVDHLCIRSKTSQKSSAIFPSWSSGILCIVFVFFPLFVAISSILLNIQ